MRRFAFTDPSGGAGRETFPLAVAHTSMFGNRAVLAGLWETKPPFSPDAVVERYAEILRSYGISVVVGDKYAGSWPSERFAAHGIRYVPSEHTKSEIFLEFLPLVSSGRVKIPHDKRLRQQFVQLERRTSRSGRDSVDHPVGSFDDLANCAAGALVVAAAASKVAREPHIEVLRIPRGGRLREDRMNDRFWHRLG